MHLLSNFLLLSSLLPSASSSVETKKASACRWTADMRRSSSLTLKWVDIWVDWISSKCPYYGRFFKLITVYEIRSKECCLDLFAWIAYIFLHTSPSCMALFVGVATFYFILQDGVPLVTQNSLQYPVQHCPFSRAVNNITVWSHVLICRYYQVQPWFGH